MYRVLLVDDEPLTLAHTRSVVERGLAQCEIIGTATNGLEGIEAIRRLKNLNMCGMPCGRVRWITF